MVAEVNDYRISRVVVLCKDCGQDVGLYPARHKCGLPASAPPVPKLPGQFLSPSRQQHSANSNTAKYGTQSDDKLRETQVGGDSLWAKLRGVKNWNDLTEEPPAAQPSQATNLWDILVNATSTLKENITGAAEDDYDSDKEDWKGETHISRVLREYYEVKGGDLPEWLFDQSSRPTPEKSLSASPTYSTSSASNTAYSAASSDRNSAERGVEDVYAKNSFRDITEKTSWRYKQADRSADRQVDRQADWTKRGRETERRIGSTQQKTFSKQYDDGYRKSDSRYADKRQEQMGMHHYSQHGRDPSSQISHKQHSSHQHQQYRQHENSRSAVFASSQMLSPDTNKTSSHSHYSQQSFPSNGDRRYALNSNGRSPSSDSRRPQGQYMKAYNESPQQRARSVSPQPSSKFYGAQNENWHAGIHSVVGGGNAGGRRAGGYF